MERFNLTKIPILENTLKTNIIIPIIISTEPLIVQDGLLYINEFDGPSMDLDCAEKIMPNTMINIPTITINSFKYKGMLNNLYVYVIGNIRGPFHNILLNSVTWYDMILSSSEWGKR